MTHNDALQWTPHPERGGGPTPPLVSRGSEEEGGERKTTEGLPSSGREGKPTSPFRCEEDASPSEQKRGERIWNRKGDEEPPLIIGRAEEKTEKRTEIASSTDQKNRHEELIRAENYAC